MNKSRALEVIALVLLVGTSRLAAQREAVQAPSGWGGLALVPTAVGYNLEGHERSLAELEVPTGTRLTAIDELDGGWIAAGDRLVADGGELVLLLSAGGGSHQIDEPSGRFGFRQRATLLVSHGRLEGLAWLEGDGGEKNSVVVARRVGDLWAPSETVSPLSDQAQLALSGTVLGDGSFLLVWAAVDGDDEEIMWSRYGDSAWSEPARIHPDNSVPDIVPAVAAVHGGALVAWSQFDGKDYRLKIARFDGENWHDTEFSGEEGSLYPTVFGVGARVGFLYSTVSPRTWSLVQVNPSGRVVRRSGIARQVEPRPLVFEASEDRVIIRFAGEDTGHVTSGSSAMEMSLEWVSEP